MNQQIKLDFSKKNIAVDDGKRINRITITCSDQFKGFFDLMVKARKTSVSELGYEYLLTGIKNDLSSVFLAQPHLDKSLRELMGKF